MMLRVENLEAAYDGIRALNGVSIEVGAGEMVAVIGSNGAGKSTLLNCMSGMVTPKAGKVWLEGKDVTGLARLQGRPRRAAAGSRRPSDTVRSDGRRQPSPGRTRLRQAQVAF